MSAINDGGPAFPVNPAAPVRDYGMSLRDWFAGQALAGMLQSCPEAPSDTIAAYCYEQADAMLAERAKEAGK